MYVCVCGNMVFKPYVCIFIHTNTQTHKHTNIYIHPYTYLSICTHLYIHTHTYTYTHICLFIYLYICMSVYIYMQFIMICHDLNSEFLPVPPANFLYCSSFKIKNFLTSFWVISSFSSAAWEIWGQ